MLEDLLCMSYASSFGRLKRGQNNLWTGLKQPCALKKLFAKIIRKQYYDYKTDDYWTEN